MGHLWGKSQYNYHLFSLSLGRCQEKIEELGLPRLEESVLSNKTTGKTVVISVFHTIGKPEMRQARSPSQIPQGAREA